MAQPCRRHTVTYLSGYVASNYVSHACAGRFFFYLICKLDYDFFFFSESQHCIKPSALKNGAFNLLDDVQLINSQIPDGAKIFFYCDDGFELQRDESAIGICQAGRWLGKTPTCVRRETTVCPAPPTVQHAYYSRFDAKQHAVFDSDLLSNLVIYFCNDGYKIAGEKTLRCENGQWTGEVPHCERIITHCPPPPNVQHATYNFYSQTPSAKLDVLIEGTEVYYFCHNSYRMKEQNLYVLMCKAGQWIGEVPVCGEYVYLLHDIIVFFYV